MDGLLSKGTVGVVKELRHETIGVEFPGVRPTYSYPKDALEPATPAAAPEQTITLNGQEYRLVPVVAEAVEEKRVPKQGEVWRRNDESVLITDEGKWVSLTGRVGRLSIVTAESNHGRFPENWTFTAPTLAAAIAAGALG